MIEKNTVQISMFAKQLSSYMLSPISSHLISSHLITSHLMCTGYDLIPTDYCLNLGLVQRAILYWALKSDVVEPAIILQTREEVIRNEPSAGLWIFVDQSGQQMQKVHDNSGQIHRGVQVGHAGKLQIRNLGDRQLLVRVGETFWGLGRTQVHP